MITLAEKDWFSLKENLADEHGASVMLLRNKCKETLGFTVRYGEFKDWPNRPIHLDFFDDTKETWFRMKYL